MADNRYSDNSYEGGYDAYASYGGRDDSRDAGYYDQAAGYGPADSYEERAAADAYEKPTADDRYAAPDTFYEMPEGRRAADSAPEQLSEMDLIDLVARMEDLLLNARNVPFTNNVMVDREELLILVGMFRDNLPDEIRRARWLISQNQQVVEESRRIAESIVRQAERREATMINEHEITLRARQRAAQTIDAANSSARQIRDGALEYADKRLTVLEEQLTSMLVTIQKNKRELR